MHISWPEIENFHNVRRAVVKYPEILGGRSTVQYRAKVKIHGTNAAVQVKSGNVLVQSRTSIIGTGNDNCGFAAWVEKSKEHFVNGYDDVIIFGEWCGPGIMKGTAINGLSNKIFAVFAAQFLGKLDDLIVNPGSLIAFVDGIPDVYVIPWASESITEVPWLEESSKLEPIVEEINARVVQADACDPWISQKFSVEGPGEGFVYYPISHSGRKHFGDLAFKAKGERHKIVAKTKPAQVDPTVAASVEAFAEMVVTDARCEQGTRAVARGELEFDPKLLGPFLAWVNKDVAKETRAELEATKLDAKLVGRAVQNRARNWYLLRAGKI